MTSKERGRLQTKLERLKAAFDAAEQAAQRAEARAGVKRGVADSALYAWLDATGVTGPHSIEPE